MSRPTPPPGLDLYEPSIPARVGPYRITGVLGAGGVGTVYRGEREDGRMVALKVLSGRIHSAGELQRFGREAAVRIQHPNIIEVLDAGADDEGRPFIAFELLEGMPLADRLRQRLFGPREVVKLGADVARGLEAAHERGIVHRDLKPENLYCVDGGPTKILDFGIALFESRQTRLTATGAVVGTPFYLAPEQARGERVLDARVDIWGIGAVLYECLAGRGPFERESALGAVLAILREDPIPITKLAPHAPRELAAVIERCLIKDRQLRWQSAAALREALEQLDVPDRPAPFGIDRADAPTIDPTEPRVVAVLLAEGTHDVLRLKGAVESRGGAFLRLYGHRAVGLFGGTATEGDELERAADAALDARGSAGHMAVAAGQASQEGGEISGQALRAAEGCIKAKLDGVAVDARSARALSQKYQFQVVQTGLLRLLERRPSSPLPPARRPYRMTEGDGGGSPDRVELIGRDAELAQIQQAIRAFLEEWRHVAVLVQGAPGIGKTRLRREVEQLLVDSEQPVQLLAARADPVGRSSALSLLAYALRRRARFGAIEWSWPSIAIDATPAERQAAVGALVGDAIDDEQLAKETAPFVGELLGIDMPETPELAAARSDPQLMADRLRLALHDYFRSMAERGPVALTVEDLQWADAASLEVIEELSGRLASEPFFVLATARPWFEEARPGFLANNDVIRIQPRGLLMSDVARLARTIAGVELSDRKVKLLADRTAGNPLFVEQIVLELRERALLNAPTEELPLPVTVQAAVQSRLDHLPLLEKSLCKRASVFGRAFTETEIESLGVIDARGLLASLQRRGLLSARPASRGGRRGREFVFRSPLIAEVAYEMQSEQIRTELHRQAAAVLSRAPEPDNEEIGFHHERGGEPGQAAARYVEATLEKAKLGDGETVLRCSDRALALGAPAWSLYEIHMARAEAMSFLGRFRAQETELDEALARADSDAERARVLVDRLGCLFRTGRLEEAATVADEAVRIARGADPDTFGLALARQALLSTMLGKIDLAMTSLADAESLTERISIRTHAVLAAASGELHGARGDLGQKRAALALAAELHASAGDLRRAARQESNLADTLNRFGAYGEAASALRTAIEKCRRVGNSNDEAYARANLGFALLRLGELESASEELEAAARMAASADDTLLRIMTRVYCIELERERDPAGAEPLGDEAAELAIEAARIPIARAAALTAAARCYLVSGAVELALAMSESAADLIRRDSLAEDESDIYVTYADALEKAGRSADAERMRGEGRQRLETAAMRIADENWRRRFLEDVASHRQLLRTSV